MKIIDHTKQVGAHEVYEKISQILKLLLWNLKRRLKYDNGFRLSFWVG